MSDETKKPQSAENLAPAARTKSKTDWKLVGVAALVLAVFGGATFVMNGGKDSLMSSVSPVASVAPATDATNGITPAAGEDEAPVEAAADSVTDTPATTPADAGAVDEDPVVARINDREIRRSEVLPVMMQALNGQNVEPSQIFPFFLEQYVSGELVIEKAKESGIEKDPMYQEQINLVKDQIARNVFLVKMADEALSDDALQALYDKEIGNVPEVDEIRARHILVKTEEEANAIIKSIKDGGDFEAIAKDKTTDPSGKANGGDLGFFSQQDMVKEFADAAFAMKIGDVSESPVKTQFGFHIVKVEEMRKRPKPSFDEVKDGLEQELRKQILENYLSELRKDSTIEIFDFNGKPLPEAPAMGEIPPAAE